MEQLRNIDWQMPIPLITNIDNLQQAYPIDSLPSIIKEAIITYQQYGQHFTLFFSYSSIRRT